jgi:hypothetical protein
LCSADEVVEAGDELAVPVGFGDPAAFFGVAGQLLGAGFLGCQDREVSGVGAEARAVLADVGVGAGPLGGGAQAEPAGQPGLQRWRVFPFRAAGDVGEREAGAAGGWPVPWAR